MITPAIVPPIGSTYSSLISDLPIPKNDIPYMGKEDDVFLTESDLPDGVHPVFFHVSIGRGIEGKYTHSAASIGFFLNFFGQSEKDTKFLISRGGVGCLFIKNHKIESLTVQKDLFDRFKKNDVKEILIRIESVFKAIDHDFTIRLYKSEEQYQSYSAKIITSLKHYGLFKE
jgi:hypothetical protein